MQLKDDVIQDVREFLQNVPVVRTYTLARMLVRKCESEITYEYAYSLLREMQSRYMLLLSEDGYVMTRGAYLRMTGDKYFDNLLPLYNYRVKEGLNYATSSVGTGAIMSMMMYAELMPYAENPIVNRGGWDLIFNTKEHDGKKSRIFCVAYFKAGFESTKANILKMVERDEEYDGKELIRRIALFEDERMTFMTPKGIGFTTVAVVDLYDRSNFRIIEKIPVKEAWSDD